MALVNEHVLKLPNNYLFADIAKKSTPSRCHTLRQAS